MSNPKSMDATKPRVESMVNKESIQKQHRVVALVNPRLQCQATCATLIESGVNLVGIVECDPHTSGLPMKSLSRLIKKNGLLRTVSQVIARGVYAFRNRRSDAKLFNQLFDSKAIERTLADWSGTRIACDSYGDAETMEQIQELQPDVLVVHSQSWVTKRVRDIPKTGLVIGGHPGITPFYRGSHSPFWALLHNKPEMVGWTVFHVDKGVDCGDVVRQGQLPIESGDSYMSLNWRGMKHIAQAQADTILKLDQGKSVPRRPHVEIPADSEFGLPGVFSYLRYLRRQTLAR